MPQLAKYIAAILLLSLFLDYAVISASIGEQIPVNNAARDSFQFDTQPFFEKLCVFIDPRCSKTKTLQLAIASSNVLLRLSRTVAPQARPTFSICPSSHPK